MLEKITIEDAFSVIAKVKAKALIIEYFDAQVKEHIEENSEDIEMILENLESLTSSLEHAANKSEKLEILDDSELEKYFVYSRELRKIRAQEREILWWLDNETK